MRSIDEYIYFNFAVLSISGSAWTALDSMFELILALISCFTTCLYFEQPDVTM